MICGRSVLRLHYIKTSGSLLGYLQLVEKVVQCLHTLHINHLDALIKNTAGNAYLIIMVDSFAKYVLTKAMANMRLYWWRDSSPLS